MIPSSMYLPHACSDHLILGVTRVCSGTRAIMTQSNRVTLRLSHFLAFNQSAVTYFQGFHADIQRQGAVQLEQLVGQWCEYVVEREDGLGSVVRVFTEIKRSQVQIPPIGQQ